MAYQYLTFDGVALPIYNPQTDLSTGTVVDPLIDTIGGVFDVAGANVRLPKKTAISVTGVYTGETIYLTDHLGNIIIDHLGNRIIVGSDSNNLRAQLDVLYAKLGKRAFLYRSRLDDNIIQWMRARLLHITHQRTVDDRMVIAHVSAQFMGEHATWHAFNATTTSGIIVSHSTGFDPLTLVVISASATVEDAIFTITPTGALSSVRVTGAGIDFTWTGTVTAGNSLIIDCGIQTVRNNGLDAYAGFVLNAGHTADGWLPLTIGENIITIQANGFGTVSIVHYNQWL